MIKKATGTKYKSKMSKVTGSEKVLNLNPKNWQEAVEVLVPESSKIPKLDYDFGRGDLNLMRDKINELIEHGN